jgi:Zn-dependent protease
MSADPLISVEIDAVVGDFFSVEEKFLDGDKPHFVVTPKVPGDKIQLMKTGFRSLTHHLRSLGYISKMEWIVGKYHIIISKRMPSSVKITRWNYILLLATTVTIFVDGYIRSSNPVYMEGVMRGIPAILNALVFTAAIILVFGVHEMGHKFIADRHGIPSSFPYFIPAWPGLGGTFGALITQKEPPVNRDELWDLGLSGPVSGLIATIIIAAVGVLLSYNVPVTEIGGYMVKYPELRFQQLPIPMIMLYLQNLLRPAPIGYVTVLHPVAFAAWVGFLVTFINLIPVWQLDGGHVIRSFLGNETHKVISAAGIVMLMLVGFVFMGVIMAFLMIAKGESVEPLDDVSPLDNRRKLGIVFYLILIGLTFISLNPI